MNYNTDYCLLKVDKPSANTHRFAMFHIPVEEVNVMHIYRNNVDMTFQEIKTQLEKLGFDFSNLRVVAKDSGKPEIIYVDNKIEGMTLATAGHIDYLLTDMYSTVAMSYENQYGFPLDLRYSYNAVPYHFLLNSIQDASYRVKRTNISNNGVLKEEEIAKADMGFDLIYSVPKYLDENVAHQEREADIEEWKYWLNRGKRGPRIVPIKNINILDVKPTESIKVVENKNLIQESPIMVAKPVAKIEPSTTVTEPEKRPIEIAKDMARELLKEKMIAERDAIKTEKSVAKPEPKTTVTEPKTTVAKSEPKTTVTGNTLSLNDYKVLQYLSGYEAPKKDKDGKKIYEPPREKLKFSGKSLNYKFNTSQVYVKVTISNPLAEKQKYEVVYYHPLADEKMYIITSEKDRSFVDFKQSLKEKYLLQFNKMDRRERYVKDGFAAYGIKDGSLVNDNKVIYSYSNLKDFYLGANTKIKSILQENSDLMYAIQKNNNEFVIKSAVADEIIKTVNSKADVENELGKTKSFIVVNDLTHVLIPVKDLDDLIVNFPEMAEKMGVQIERLTV